MASNTSSSSSSALSHPTIPNPLNPSNPLVALNISSTSTIKLTPTNYLSWKLQFEAILIGYNLDCYVNGTLPAPPPTITTENRIAPNPAYQTWYRQDKLIFSALVGSLSPSVVPLLNRAITSREAWQILETTYAKLSRGHIKQIKDQIKRPLQGTRSISDYMQFIRSRADELALLGKPLDDEDLIDKVLDGLDDAYKSIADAVNARETPISFDELYEKLLNKELLVRQSKSPHPASLPATANPASMQPRQRPWRPSSPAPPHHQWSSNSHSRSERPPPRPYQGTCQACSTYGHSAKRCTQFRLVTMSAPHDYSVSPSQLHGPRPSGPRPHSPWQPRAHYAFTPAPPSQPWILDSGASHHITADLGNLSLHAPYEANDEVMIGDGTNLPITHSGSAPLPSSSRTLTLDNILCVPSIKKNRISISQLCSHNNVSVEFMPFGFVVKDLCTGLPLMTGPTKDGVYVWPDFLSLSLTRHSLLQRPLLHARLASSVIL